MPTKISFFPKIFCFLLTVGKFTSIFKDSVVDPDSDPKDTGIKINNLNNHGSITLFKDDKL